MTTARRRPLEPNLSWPPGGVGRQFRVAVRNEETGEKRTIYDGTRPGCRLPADFRLSPDQLSYRVESRLADDSYAPFRRHIEFTGIDRIGDDFETDAPDLLTAEAHPRATAYRLVVRDRENRDDRFADFQRADPRFLLPPGRLEGRSAEYAILPRVDDRWVGSRWKPVTEAMVAAAQARSERLIELPREPSPRDHPNDAKAPPGWARSATPPAARLATLVAIDATLAPLLADAPEADRLTAEQWLDAKGAGLVSLVADRLASAGLSGVFFLDVEAAAVFGLEAASRLAKRLESQGHGVELLHDPQPWRIAGEIDEAEAPDAAVARSVKRFVEIVGRRPRLARLGGAEATWPVLEAFAREGLAGLVVRPGQTSSLPRWMQGRVRPFAAVDGLAVLPVSTVLSTPAHARDRVVRHELTATDALVAATAQAIVEAQPPTRPGAASGELVIAYIDPLSLLAVQRTVNPKAAEVWNAAVRRQADWTRAGWMRGDDGYDFASGISEVAVDILDNMIVGLARGGAATLDPTSGLDRDGLTAWIDDGRAWDLVVEQRRGPRRMRRSAVRRYDNAFRQALATRPA
ncbi:hypothetical protein [Brevundimonas sp.]|uniref:hypothetical protein n=1 Tax=Brevundimonas sp. TaxID=1871086 RepID=UPI0035AE23EE